VPRKSVRPLAEDTLCLDVNFISREVRTRALGRLTWRGTTTKVDYRWDARESALHLSLPGGKQQGLKLVKISIGNGGHRWLFDLGARRAGKMYYLGDLFRSRQALGLRYLSQALVKRRREERRVERILSVIGPAGSAVKRSGLRTRRWRKLVARLEELQPSIKDPGPRPG
jgi:hypothetical protein